MAKLSSISSGDDGDVFFLCLICPNVMMLCKSKQQKKIERLEVNA